MTLRNFFGAVLLACACTGWAADGRVAFVAGNNDYASGSKLVNAVSDARAMAQVLRAAGWEVLEVHDASHANFEATFAKFLGRLGKGGEGVFYFSGHGLELARQNFLLPVDFDGSSADAAAKKAIPLQDLIRRISAVSPRAVAMILDACRANPALKGLMPRPGLGEVAQAVPAGMFMMYGAGAGQLALDRLSANDPVPHGLFTRELLAAMGDDSLDFRQIARRARVSVIEKALAVNHVQIPSVYDTLPLAPFQLKAGNSAAIPAPSAGLSGASIRLIAPVAMNSPSDQLARKLAARMGKALNASVEVENVIDIPGAKVAELVGTAPADGKTWLLSPYAASMSRLQRGDGRLKPVGMVSETRAVLAVPANSPVSNVASLLAHRVSLNRPLKMGISGAGATSEACQFELERAFGPSLVQPVVLPGMALVVGDLMAGNLDLACDVQSSFERHAQSGRLKMIASLQENALVSYPPVSAQAQGFPVVIPVWWALFVPKDLPAQTVQDISAALQQLQSDPQWLQERTALDSGTQILDVAKATPLEVGLSLRLGASLNQVLSRLRAR
ncbi:MAG: tripartite tricarboxylate transporter substrate-binding protein [Pseudomonadota bacterium]